MFSHSGGAWWEPPAVQELPLLAAARLVPADRDPDRYRVTRRPNQLQWGESWK